MLYRVYIKFKDILIGINHFGKITASNLRNNNEKIKDMLQEMDKQTTLFESDVEIFMENSKVFGSFEHKNNIHSISISNLILINSDSLKFSLKLEIFFAYLLSSGWVKKLGTEK